MPNSSTRWMRYILFGIAATVIILGIAQFMSAPKTETVNEPASQSRKMF